jgi:hypothetical protein
VALALLLVPLLLVLLVLLPGQLDGNWRPSALPESS